MKICLVLTLCLTSTAWADRLDDYDAPPAGSVRVLRDRYGVPHIIARDNRSLFYGVGYAQAEDQLENLVTNLLRGEGRAAEREGKSQLSADHIMRLFKVPARARDQFANLDDAIREQLSAFADGVNAYIDEHRGEIPDWVEPIEPHQVLGFSMYINTMFSVGHCQRDLSKAGIKVAASAQALPGRGQYARLSRGSDPRDFGDRWELLRGLDASLGEADFDFGSNQFAVAPARSASGACMLSMDPHLRHSGFFRWYEMHLVGPEINAMGACFFGNPYVTMGRTEQTAWCMTVNGPDLGDVFALKINPDNPRQYKGLDGWQEFETGAETYRIATPQGTVEKTLPARWSEVGPVVAQRDGTAYAFALPVTDAPAPTRQSYEMLKAQNLTEFREAIKNLELVMFNIAYADRHGDIFYISNGRVPVRDQRIASSEIRPGDEAWARWQGIHKQSELPQVHNPPNGYLLNTNSGPQTAIPEGAPDPKDFPKYMMSHRSNSRSRRLAELLAADESITFDEMRDYATDTRVDTARDNVPGLIAAIDADTETTGEDAALLANVKRTLAGWDQRADLDSRGAVLYFALLTDDRVVKAMGAQQPQEIVAAIVTVARAVHKKFGALDVPWKQFSRIRRGEHELGIAGTGSARTPAGISTIGTALRPTYGEIKDGQRFCTGGSSYGMIVDFSGETRAISCLPFGVSEHPDSPHFADQLQLYVKRQFKPAWFTPDELRSNAETNRVLTSSQ